MSERPILLSAGEASSDMYAAQLATALRARTGAPIFGMGGPRMKEAGVELVADYHEVAVVGITEVLHKIPTVIGVQNRLKREAKARNAKLAVLVDSPGTHLGVARRMKQIHVPVGYFIGPQVWAWRPGRVKVVKRLVNRMVVIFPFEEPIYREAGVPVDFVGHPLVDTVRSTMSRAEFATRHGLDAGRQIVTILPGSRPNEIVQNYPRVAAACERLAKPGGPQFVHAAAHGLSDEFFAQHARPNVKITRVRGETYEALAAADCAIVASGTATVEAALLGTPMVVIYRVKRTTAVIMKRLIRTPYIAMVNLIGGRRVVPELIQNAFTPEAVEIEARRILESAADREEIKAGLAEVRAKLGPGGAIERAADIFAGML
ncbi:MAG TPA: lipid-A-disaccharide synthase [Candidatus Acidoferrales bacterium]